MMNLAGELVLGRNQLRQNLEKLVYENPKLGHVMQNVDVVTSELQENIVKMRLQPVGKLFNRFPRLVRDTSRKLFKEAELVLEGLEVELDKSILESLSDPLIHMVRNCLDHGIEPPEQRARMGKPRTGQIRLGALHEGGQVIITIADDGAGIDGEKVVEKALSDGAVEADHVRTMTQDERLELIFLPGLSTAKAVSDVSGRGVGMDVVKTNIEEIGGHIEIESVPERGTTIRIRLPLTLAIIPSLIVGAGGRRFAIPQVNVQELVCVRAADASRKIEMLGDVEVLRLRERLLPIVSLTRTLNLESEFIHPSTGPQMTDRMEWLADHRPPAPIPTEAATEPPLCQCQAHENCDDCPQHPESDINVVVLRVGVNRMGLGVEELFDTQEIVVKPLANHVKDCQCFAGSTIMNDGSVAMILDATGMAESAGLHFAEVRAEERRREKHEARIEESRSCNQQSILVFNNALEECFALPLGDVSRLEITDPQRIERIGEREFVAYRGEGLPLVYLHKFLPVRPTARNGDELYFIIPKNKRSMVGIVASRILDTIETDVTIKKDAAMARGLAGSAIVDGRLTMFLNVEEILDLYEEGEGTGNALASPVPAVR
jgi:two-component system chemotaxis sensor kinase CheA